MYFLILHTIQFVRNFILNKNDNRKQLLISIRLRILREFLDNVEGYSIPLSMHTIRMLHKQTKEQRNTIDPLYQYKSIDYLTL